MKRKYWEIYYKKKKKLFKPSNFSKFINKKKIINKKSNILEMGCGDGRDSFYFSKTAQNIVAVDSHSNNKKNNIYKINNNIKNIKFLCVNVAIKNQFKLLVKEKNLILYMLVFLHAINEKSEKNLFKNFDLLSKKIVYFSWISYIKRWFN